MPERANVLSVSWVNDFSFICCSNIYFLMLQLSVNAALTKTSGSLHDEP